MMAHYVVRGGAAARGEVQVSGAKNSATKLLIAALLSPEPCTIRNVPRIRDVDLTMEICRALGASCAWVGPSTVRVHAARLRSSRIPMEHSGAMRTAVLFVAPLLSRLGEADLRAIGGCNIGSRPVDFHVAGLEHMGVEVRQHGEEYRFRSSGLKGADIELPYPSVGATEHLMIAAACADGVTTITNGAIEPEIGDLAAFLTCMGARVSRQTRKWTIRGVARPRGAEISTIPDRNEVASLACLALATDGEVIVGGARVEHLGSFLDVVHRVGGRWEDRGTGIRFTRDGPLRPVDVRTDVHPGFMSDWQPPLVPLLTQCWGTSRVTETVYEDRLGYIDSLVDMGARIQPVEEEHGIEVTGPVSLVARDLEIPDLRAGFAYVVAALLARGESRVGGIENVERGYAGMVEKLRLLGCDIRLISTEPVGP